MKRIRFILPGTLIMLAVFMLSACPSANNPIPDPDPDPETHPDITGFSFTAAAELQAGTDGTAEGAIVGTLGSPTGGTAPFVYSLAEGGGSDNSGFELDGADLKIKDNPLIEGTYKVILNTTDSKGKTFTKIVILGIAASAAENSFDRTVHLAIEQPFSIATAVSSNTTTAGVVINEGGGSLTLTLKKAGTFNVFAYSAAHEEISVTGLTIDAAGSFDISGKTETAKSIYPVYNSADTAGGSVFDEIKGKTSGTYLLRGAPTRPAVDENGKSDWGIPAGVTLVLMNGSTWHMHTQYNYTGLGTFKYEATSGNATMLPGGTPSNGYTFQVSTLEIGGTLWLVGGIARISGAMTSPGGIVRMLGGTKLLTGESGSETLTVSDAAEHGGAYWHVIVKNLVLGSSTLTIKDAITFAAVTVTENATYGGFTMDSSALGLGNSGAALVINAPGKTVTVKSIDCENGKLASITVQAGTLAVTDAEDGLTNIGSTEITIEPGASLTINGVPYTSGS
ncbi:MAG: hypothetical protein LBP23_08495 [Treponema sp.]|jgi:hypothetical protein|nr:hypothetical protein [Treponema sp.]